jgi:hypothetical protein
MISRRNGSFHHRSIQSEPWLAQAILMLGKRKTSTIFNGVQQGLAPGWEPQGRRVPVTAPGTRKTRAIRAAPANRRVYLPGFWTAFLLKSRKLALSSQICSMIFQSGFNSKISLAPQGFV